MSESNVPAGHTAFRRVTSDEVDPHRSWTVQQQNDQGNAVAFPNQFDERNVVTKFARSELPDPQKAVDAGLLPLLYPDHLIDDTHVTQGPAGDVPQDDPVRDRYTEDPGYEASKGTDVSYSLEEAKAQKEGESLDKDTNGGKSSRAKAASTSSSGGSDDGGKGNS